MLNYSCKEIGRIKTEGCWDQIIVGVFKDDVKVGEYIKGYNDSPKKTFQPFIGPDGKDYAIISGEDYTLATVISLPDCQVACIENNPNPGYGFCPVEIWVPTLYQFKDYAESEFFTENVYGEDLLDVNIKQPMFALVQGCIWGDDTSWKLEVYDLRQIPNRIIRTAPFGYLELASGKLQDLVKITCSSKFTDFSIEAETKTYLRMNNELLPQ